MVTPTPQQVYNALLNGNNDLLLIENLVSTGEAAFSFIRTTDLDDDVKYAFFELEKRFQFFAKLVFLVYGDRSGRAGVKHA